MTWLEFIAAVLSALAWPAAVFAIFYLLRRPLGALLRRLRPKQMRYRGVEVDFGGRVEQAEELAEQAAELAEVGPVPIVGAHDAAMLGTRSPLAMLLRYAPRAAVLESWLAVETGLERLAETYGVDASVHALKGQGAISQGLGALIRELRKIWQAAVDAEEFAISEAEALRYAETCSRVAEALRVARDAAATTRR